MDRDVSPPPTKRRKIIEITRDENAVAPPLLPPDPNDASTLRLFSWNINGIEPFLQKSITTYFTSDSSKSYSSGSAPASLRAFLHRQGWPALLFLQEVKIAPRDLKTQDAVRRALNEKLPSEVSKKTTGPDYNAHFTLPNDIHNARGLRGNGKVYGVCSVFRSDLLTRFGVRTRTVDWDKEGRISVLELTGCSSKLALFNIYAVNGTGNPYRNPSTGMILGTRHDRKLQFHRLLMEECSKLEGDGWHVLLIGDMNVALDARDGHPKLRTFPEQHVLNRADFHVRFLGGTAKEATQFDGVDVWRRMHGDQRQYTYYPRGRAWGSSCDRIDYAILGKKSWNEGYVKDAGILDTAYERGASDHVPIWVDIRIHPNKE